MTETNNADFVRLNCAVLTVSDTRDESTDTSGKYLVDALTGFGHHLIEKKLLIDDIYKIRAQVAHWIASPEIQVILTTGGTGLTGRDVMPEAVSMLFDKPIQGFGEMFRMLSYDEVCTSTIQSRAIAGLSNGTLVFCCPGSNNACKTAWEKILEPQLDSRVKPCNFVKLLPRFKE